MVELKPYYTQSGITIYHASALRTWDTWVVDDGCLVTDPPYGTGNGHCSEGYGRRELGPVGITNDTDTVVRDTVLFNWGDIRPALVFASPRAPAPPGNWTWRLVWDKGRPGLGAPWRWTHEEIYVRGNWKNNPGRPSVLRFAAPKDIRASMHPHEKPVELLMALIVGAPGKVIVDPCMGSGATLVAAKNLGREAIGVEIEERYCEIAAKRLRQEVFSFVQPRLFG